MDEYNQTFVISEAAHWDSQQKFKKTKPIAIKETDIGEGWVRVELAWAVRVWLEGRERLHTLHVACRTCQVRNNTVAYLNQPTNQSHPISIIVLLVGIFSPTSVDT